MEAPRIAVTPGEPAGIGPDLCIKLAHTPGGAQWVTVADPDLLLQRADELELPVSIIPYIPEQHRSLKKGELCVSAVPLRTTASAGVLNPDNSAYVLETLRQAAQGCRDGEFDALVTGPVHKAVINDGGHAFTGHTEFLADLTNSFPVMMLATKSLRVALVTTHLPLHAVSAAITNERLRNVIHTLNTSLRTQFGIKIPRILVCGLNPHAGENGHLGHEEIEVIQPTLEALRSEGIQLDGPLPADTAFTPGYLLQADAVLAMYHDQGLPVLKHAGFGEAVNITLGLPIIRTSVDHGTALTLAGTGQANTGSLTQALNMAITMVNRSRDMQP